MGPILGRPSVYVPRFSFLHLPHHAHLDEYDLYATLPEVLTEASPRRQAALITVYLTPATPPSGYQAHNFTGQFTIGGILQPMAVTLWLGIDYYRKRPWKYTL